MKYIINESRLNNAIEKFLKKNYDFIVSVSFHEKSVWLASEDRGHTATVITIIVDPYKILEGNTKGQFKQYNREIRRDIWNRLNTFFSLGFDKYGSDWDIEVYGIKLEPI
jgi:hypothetical protein